MKFSRICIAPGILAVCMMFPISASASASLWMKAAEQGDMNAQYNLGKCYWKEDGVPADPRKALKWFMKAAEQGHADAQYLVGLHYDRGSLVPLDVNKAAEWYKKAADQGHRPAQVQLDNIYAERKHREKLRRQKEELENSYKKRQMLNQ